MCLRNGVDENKTSRFYENDAPYTAAFVNLFIMIIAFVYEAKYSKINSGGMQMTTVVWQNSHVFRPGLWWWMFRSFLTFTSVFLTSFFSMANCLSPENGGRAYYPRQMVVHGHLLFISTFFVHMILVARDANYNGSYPVEEVSHQPTTTTTTTTFTDSDRRSNSTTRNRTETKKAEKLFSATSTSTSTPSTVTIDGRSIRIQQSPVVEDNEMDNESESRREISTESEEEDETTFSLTTSSFQKRHRQHISYRSTCLFHTRLFCNRCYWFGLVERPAVVLHGISVHGWRCYATAMYFKNKRFTVITPVGTEHYADAGVIGDPGFLTWFIVGIITFPIFWSIAHMIAKVRTNNDTNYQSSFMKRWSILLLIQFCAVVAGFMGPGGTPTYFSLVSANICIIGVLVESLLGTIPSRSFDVWTSKYHVILAIAFATPLILLSAYQTVAVLIGSYEGYGQIHVANVGAIGGDSNQMRGGSNRVGWWWGGTVGPYIPPLVMVCYSGMLLSMLVLPYAFVCIGLRGPKAPSYLSDVLAATDGHIPLLSRSNRFHFFLSKHEKRKKIALQIADALKDAGFKVWVSQHEASHGNPTDKDAMQLGVKLSESILLLMTQGIFHRDRFWVVKTEVMYGIEECHKPLICVTPVDHNKGFDFDTKVSGVEEKCISF